jgi:hypothetical protein
VVKKTNFLLFYLPFFSGAGVIFGHFKMYVRVHINIGANTSWIKVRLAAVQVTMGALNNSLMLRFSRF